MRLHVDTSSGPVPYLSRSIIEEYADLIVKAIDGHEVHLNKLLLISWSNGMKNVLSSEYFEDCSQEVIISSNLSKTDLEIIFEFVMKGNLPCSELEILNDQVPEEISSLFASFGIDICDIVKSFLIKSEEVNQNEISPKPLLHDLENNIDFFGSSVKNEPSESMDIVHDEDCSDQSDTNCEVTKLQCEFCEKTFTNEKTMEKHVTKCPNKLKCHLCIKEFASIEHLKRHFAIVHQQENVSFCDNCFKTFEDEDKFEFHIKWNLCDNRMKEPTKKKIKKTKVRNISPKKESAKSQILNHHETKSMYVCETCCQVFQTQDELKEHDEINHQVALNFSCELCEKKFKNRTRLSEHMKTDHPQKSCSECDKKFGTLIELRHHRKIFHGINSKTIMPTENVCEECGKVFSGQGPLKKHRDTIHVPDQKLPCDKCGQTFKNKLYLRDHKATFHNKHPCPECGKMFHPVRMKKHIIAMHTDEHLKTYNCDVCQKGFAYWHTLKKHMNTHTGQKPYNCKYCGRGFADDANARAHERSVHEGQKRVSKKLDPKL